MLRLNEHQLLQSYSVYFVICFDIQVFFFHHATAELSNGFFNGSDEPGQGNRFKQIIYGVEFKTVNGILGIGRGKYYGSGDFQVRTISSPSARAFEYRKIIYPL
jgi:hypothetical protein